MTEWRDVVGYEGLYEVSDDGLVRSLDRITTHGRMRDRVRHGTDPSANKTECPSGHPYDKENTARWGEAQKRQCRECDRQRHRGQGAKV